MFFSYCFELSPILYNRERNRNAYSLQLINPIYTRFGQGKPRSAELARSPMPGPPMAVPLAGRPRARMDSGHIPLSVPVDARDRLQIEAGGAAIPANVDPAGMEMGQLRGGMELGSVRPLRAEQCDRCRQHFGAAASHRHSGGLCLRPLPLQGKGTALQPRAAGAHDTAAGRVPSYLCADERVESNQHAVGVNSSFRGERLRHLPHPASIHADTEDR